MTAHDLHIFRYRIHCPKPCITSRHVGLMSLTRLTSEDEGCTAWEMKLLAVLGTCEFDSDVGFYLALAVR